MKKITIKIILRGSNKSKNNNQYNSTCHPERSAAESKDLAQRVNVGVCCEFCQYDVMKNNT